MRRGRSTLLLLLVALGLGAYIYFVESKREPTGDALPKKDKVFAIESGKLEEIRVQTAAGESTTVRRSGADWQIVEPETLEADSGEIGSLVSTIETLELQRVIDENPASASTFGLEPARFSVAFKTEGDATTRRLQVGNRTPTGADLYARVEGQSRVFLISAYVEDSLNKSMFTLRDKTVLKFVRDDVDSLTVQPATGPTLAFARKESAWRFTKPMDAKADFGGVDGIVSRLSTVRMKSVVAADGTAELNKYGLDKPQATAIVGSGSAQATLAIGAKADDASLYARDLSRPLVFTVESTLLDDLGKNPDDLRIKDLFEFRSFSAVGIDIALGQASHTFGKEKPAGADQASAPDVWKQMKPEARDVDQTKMTDLLTSLSNLRAMSFAERALTTGEELTVTARFGDAASPQTETMRFRKSGTTVHALVPGEPGAAVVSAEDFDKALALFKELAGIK